VPNKKTFYQEIITDILEKHGVRGVDPRHVEAWMRVEHPTLDALVNWQWEKEVALSVACIKEAGIEDSEALAQSYGLVAA
jgi:hypothetical protein